MEKRTESGVLPSMQMESLLAAEDDEFIYSEEDEQAKHDLSYWEFINFSDSESDGVLSLDDDGFASSSSSLASSSENIPTHDPVQSHGFGVDQTYFKGDPDHGYGGQHVDEYDHGVGYSQEEDDLGDDYDDDHGYGLDDELVPWAVSGKFGRQRMRKVGKRAFAKMYTSKRSPFLYVKPGCVHGKHGLGLKHCC